ncbi:MAG: glycoside hydrolase family 15 protein [Thermoanaerobacterales bacterium]|nr:glycoside hydrolase family 15 protein [Thermoanaerobacterales bacterium]
MPRPLVLSNGNLMVNFDEALYMRDLYYPYVGMENHIAGHRCAIGFWDDGCFSWIHQPRWQKRLGYTEDAPVTDIRARNVDMGLALSIADAVYPFHDLYLKRIEVKNLCNHRRELRVFFYNDFYVGGSDVGNTALYDPETGGMCHYRRDYYILVNGRSARGGVAQYGVHKRRGPRGRGRLDAEDGHLEGKAIDQGSVDSSMAFVVPVEPGGHAEILFWIAAGRSLDEVRRLDALVRERGLESLMRETVAYWRSWLSSSRLKLGLLPEHLARHLKRSLLVTRSQIDNRGGILAANDTDILATNRDHYSYVWPRDGALVAYALDLAGFSGITAAFFRFAARTLTTGGYFLHKYNPDGTPGSSWHPWVKDGEPQLAIQEDETGLVLWALWHHYLRQGDFEFMASLYPSLVCPAADFLAEYRDPLTGLPAESYDLWEERRGVFTFTVAAVCAGLTAAAGIAAMVGDGRSQDTWYRAAEEIRQGLQRYLYSPRLGRFLRGLTRGAGGELVPDGTLDASLWGVFGFGVLPAEHPYVMATMQAIADGLTVKTDVGGVARYTGDYYFRHSDDISKVPGNPWFICTLWLADWYIARAHSEAELAPALELLEWCCRHSGPTGHFAEQLHPYTGEPLSVSPLTWSHATFCHVTAHYLGKLEELRAGLRLS